MTRQRLQTLKPTLPVLSQRLPGPPQIKRITGNSLYALMRRFERDHPRMCAECSREGFTRPGDHLDHITPLWAGGSNSTENLQWLCLSHHEAKTAQEAKHRANGDPGAV